MEVPNPLLRRFLSLRANYDNGRVKSSPDFHPTQMEIMYALLNKHAEMVSALSPWQIGHGLRNYAPAANEPISSDLKIKVTHSGDVLKNYHDSFVEFPFNQDSIFIMQHYRTIQFYAGLTEEQRKALLTNQLGFDSLSAIQKQQVAYLIPKVISALKQTEYPVVIGLMPRYHGEEKTSTPFGHLVIASPPQ